MTYLGAAEPLRRVWIALRAFGPTVLETLTLADIVSGELWLPGRRHVDTGCLISLPPYTSRAAAWSRAASRWRWWASRRRAREASEASSAGPPRRTTTRLFAA